MWGDGKQTRSFTFIDDCVEGILRITKSDFRQPLNLGSSEMVGRGGGGRGGGGGGAGVGRWWWVPGFLGCRWCQAVARVQACEKPVSSRRG